MPGKIVSQEEWLTARKELLAKEKAATHASDTLNSSLRSFPMVKLSTNYVFEGPSSQVTLTELFAGRKQLIVYHFMLGPDDSAGCQGCSFLTDNLPSSLKHLNYRDTTLVLISRAPYPKIAAFKERMGWNFPWYSAFGSDFNYDFHATQDENVKPLEYNFEDEETLVKEKSINLKGEQPGLSVFFKKDGEVFHTYSTYARGLEGLLGTYRLLDLTPLGRQEDEKMGWKLHDEYEVGEIGL